MVENRDGFEPFIEDDEPFDKYMGNMRKDAEWGGHLELQVASLVHVHVPEATHACAHAVTDTAQHLQAMTDVLLRW